MGPVHAGMAGVWNARGGGGRARVRRASRNFMAQPQAGQQTTGLSGGCRPASPARPARQQPQHHPVGLQRPGAHPFQLDMPGEAD